MSKSALVTLSLQELLPRYESLNWPEPTSMTPTANEAKPPQEKAAEKGKAEAPEYDPETAPKQRDFEGWDWNGGLIDFSE